jgi:nucleoside-diphosphate-sugar epimerase
MEESDPRFLREPNFYFAQEDLLWQWAEKEGVEWVVTRPGFIIGAVREASMSIAYGLAIYAAVQKELGGTLAFPGDSSAWDAEKHLTSAHLLGYHAEWALLAPNTKNQILNSADGSLFTYGKFWPLLAALHGIPYETPQLDETKYVSVEMPTRPPPRGFGPPGTVKVAWTFEDWAAKPEVRKAWDALKARHSLVPDPFDRVQDIFGLLDAELLGPWGRSLG